MPVNREQRERIEHLALTDKRVVEAFRRLERTNPCNDVASERALNQVEKSLDVAVREAAQKLNLRLSNVEGDRIEQSIINMSLEGRPSVCPIR